MRSNIVQGNKLLDEFMGVRGIPDAISYASDWNKIMAVIDKIESLGFFVALAIDSCQIYDKSKDFPENFIIDADFHNDKKVNAFEGIVSFVEWYNEKQIKNGKD